MLREMELTEWDRQCNAHRRLDLRSHGQRSYAPHPAARRAAVLHGRTSSLVAATWPAAAGRLNNGGMRGIMSVT
jgi:hypothetical protein